MIEVCDETLALFEAKPFTMKNFMGIIKNQKVIALLMLKRYEACQITLNEALDLQEQGNFNWFKTMEKKVLLTFHTAHYTEGVDLRETGYKIEVFPYDELWVKLLPWFGDKKLDIQRIT